jgi:DNA-binding protein Fis
VNSKLKLIGLLILTGSSAAYFTNISGSDVNTIYQEILFLVPLQILAFTYVTYYYYCQKRAAK